MVLSSLMSETSTFPIIIWFNFLVGPISYLETQRQQIGIPNLKLGIQEFGALAVSVLSGMFNPQGHF